MHVKVETGNPQAVRVSPLTSWRGGRITPGRGTADLRIGQSISDVVSVLGYPDQKISRSDRLFYVYRSLGVDVDFGQSRSAKQLFFYNANVEGHTKRAPVTVGGITFRSSKNEIVTALGKPQSKGGPVRVSNRKKTWIYYASGLQFDFDSRDRVIIISVCDPKLH